MVYQRILWVIAAVWTGLRQAKHKNDGRVKYSTRRLMTSVACTPLPVTAVKINTTQIPVTNTFNILTDIGPWNVTLSNLTYQSYGYGNDNLPYYEKTPATWEHRWCLTEL